MKKLGAVFILLSILSLLFGCSYYSKGPWRGKLLDAETREPIEGAAILAVWQHGYPAVPEYQVKFFDARETTSDKNGYFEIPKFTKLTFATDEIWDPEFAIFKPGYSAFPGPYTKPNGIKIEQAFKYPLLKEEAVFLIPKLKTNEERRENLRSVYPGFYIPREKRKNIMELINEENKFLGLEPVSY